MENINYTSEAGPDLPVEKIGIIEDGYNQMGMDDSLLLDMDVFDGENRIEYRHAATAPDDRLKR